MKRTLIAATAALAMTGLGATGADAVKPTSTDKDSASKQCKALRTAMGEANFKATYGTNENKSNAFGKCVSKLAKQHADRNERAKTNAAKLCKAEQDDPNFAATHGGKTFDQFYGTNKNGNNAYGKCVSAKVKAQQDANAKKDAARVNAAKACRAEQKSIGSDAFKAKYGTNKNKSNAFGKCVSKTTKA